MRVWKSNQKKISPESRNSRSQVQNPNQIKARRKVLKYIVNKFPEMN